MVLQTKKRTEGLLRQNMLKTDQRQNPWPPPSAKILSRLIQKVQIHTLLAKISKMLRQIFVTSGKIIRAHLKL